MQENLDKDQIERILDHRNQSIESFYNRLNSFLIFESILFGVVGLLYGRPNSPLLPIKLFIAFGIVITLIWWYVQARQRHHLNVVNAYAKEVSPEYRAILAKLKKEIFPSLSRSLLTHAVPFLVLLVWIILLFFL
jgi:hypothetical protein